MKKSVKIISTLMIVAILVCMISTVCLATDDDPFSGLENGTAYETDEFAGKVADILATIRNIAAIIAVVIVAILGIKYMLGSVEEKAEYKKSFVPLIVGMAVVLSALQIAKMIFGTFAD